MNQRRVQAGMAIALLLWMLAAMALMVSAVVHFARGDTSMVQLRLQESKAEWLGRGVVFLALRDRALAAQFAPPLEEAESADGAAAQSTPEMDMAAMEQIANPDVIFKRDYSLGDAEVQIKLYPISGLVSLNTATPEELRLVFQQLGGLDVNSAARVVEAISEYRAASSPVSFDMLDNPGFRYVEELLAMPGMTRSAYDLVKPWVHVHASGSVDLTIAPAPLASALGAGERVADVVGTNAGAPRPQVASMTFDALYAQARGGRGSAGGSDVLMAELEFVFNTTDRYRQMIQVDSRRQQLMRVDSVISVPKRAPKQ